MSASRPPLCLALLAALALPLAPACGGDDDDGGGSTDDGVDAGAGDGADDGIDDGIDASAGDCDAAEVLPGDYRPIGSVSTGEVTTSADGEIVSAQIDATAGGLIGVADNPYVYVDLEGGGKVDIDDVAALTSEEWDVAFKRASIRVNGGDSGPADVAIARVDGALADVTEAPADDEFATDDWTSDSCTLLSLPDGTPATAFGEWYDYDDVNHTLAPKAEVYVVRTRSGDLVKISIDDYYGDEGDPTRGALYQVSWAPL